MRRVTIDVDPRPLHKTPPYFVDFNMNQTPNTEQMSLALAANLFTCHDDQVLLVPATLTERPRQTMLWQNGYRSAYPDRLTDRSGLTSNDYPLARDYEGNYSWMAVVTPMPDAIDFRQQIAPNDPSSLVGYCYTDRIKRYLVSIVVFYKRNANTVALQNTIRDYPAWLSTPAMYWQDLANDPPPERAVDVRLEGDGWGGGDVTLIGNAPSSVNTPSARLALEAAWLKVKANDWIMLMAPDGPLNVPETRMVYQWYRVVSVTDDDPLPTENELGLGDLNGNG
jgi:hypothetical protein